MGYIIKRLYVENYKLFSSKEIDFENAVLSVFDGPNGYGKTSVFDAIEFLVTGSISRIVDNDSIMGNTAYNTIFLAKDSQRDLIIKGEFYDKEIDSSIYIGIKIKASHSSGRENNPKKVFETADNYWFPLYNIADEDWGDYIVSKEQIKKYREQSFGELNIRQFTIFNYVRQEDRLAFFKRTEKDRGDVIQTLLGIEKESERCKKIYQTQKELSTKLRLIETKIEQIKTQINEKPQLQVGKIAYRKLMDDDYPWDIEDIVFEAGKIDLLNSYLYELDTLQAYIKFKQWHPKYKAVRNWNKIPEEKKKIILSAWLCSRGQEINKKKLEDVKNRFAFLKQQNNLIMENQLLNVDYKTLCKELKVDEWENLLSAKVTSLKQLQDVQDSLQKSIMSILSSRQKLHTERTKLKQIGLCPYCGEIWENEDDLENHYLEAEEKIHHLLVGDGKKYDDIYKTLDINVKNTLLPVLEKEIKSIQENQLVTVYIAFEDRQQFFVYFDVCNKIMNIIFSGDFKDIAKENVEKLLSRIRGLSNDIPEEYLKVDREYNFEAIGKKYFDSKIIAETLTESNIEYKKQFLKYKYFESFDNLTVQFSKLKNERERLNQLCSMMKEYHKVLKASIANYEKQIIDQIEIPFFIYSSRLLQSYQGGQGILMKNDGKSIRFTVPGSEHDVLYTMSSGQLSAVLLSFSLAMNKVFAGNGIKALFIDDPIQCMDDINMISFVELLRCEFSDNQIIVSTHEDSFANFIRYKFKKYKIEAKSITLKDA